MKTTASLFFSFSLLILLLSGCEEYQALEIVITSPEMYAEYQVGDTIPVDIVLYGYEGEEIYINYFHDNGYHLKSFKGIPRSYPLETTYWSTGEHSLTAKVDRFNGDESTDEIIFYLYDSTQYEPADTTDTEPADTTQVIVFDTLITEGLLASFTFDSTLMDESAFFHQAEFINGKYAMDRFGEMKSCAFFNGEDAYMRMPDELRFRSESSYTIAFWMKTQMTTNIELFSQWTDWSGPDGFNFGIFFNAFEEKDIQFHFPATVHLELSDVAFNNRTWNYLVFMKDKECNSMTFYFNGEFVDSTGIVDEAFEVNGDLMVGRSNFIENYYKGFLDDLLIYDRVLSAEEISILYHLKDWDN